MEKDTIPAKQRLIYSADLELARQRLQILKKGRAESLRQQKPLEKIVEIATGEIDGALYTLAVPPIDVRRPVLLLHCHGCRPEG